MKMLSTAIIAAALVTVAVQSNPTVDPRLSGSEALQSFVTAQAMPGECCNDDFRQALPLWEGPMDDEIMKP